MLGEIETTFNEHEIVDLLVPLEVRSDEEMHERANATAEHKAHRAELYKRYSVADRLKDLGRPGKPHP
jgi:hypothetical protein